MTHCKRCASERTALGMMALRYCLHSCRVRLRTKSPCVTSPMRLRPPCQDPQAVCHGTACLLYCLDEWCAPLSLLTLPIVCSYADNTRISTLNISANNFGDRGASSLAEMLKSSSTLESLDISSNNVDYDGITALSAALVENTTLRALYIGCAFY
jgi:hypothetical protein